MEVVGPNSIDLKYKPKKEPLISFLTQEEGVKAMNGNFADLGLWNLYQRAAIEAKNAQYK